MCLILDKNCAKNVNLSSNPFCSSDAGLKFVCGRKWVLVVAGFTKVDSDAEPELGSVIDCSELGAHLAGKGCSSGLLVQDLTSVSTDVSAGLFLVGRA